MEKDELSFVSERGVESVNHSSSQSIPWMSGRKRRPGGRLLTELDGPRTETEPVSLTEPDGASKKRKKRNKKKSIRSTTCMYKLSNTFCLLLTLNDQRVP